MNNTIIVKGADFSQGNVGSLNIQKLTVTKGGNASQTVTGGALTIVPDSAGFAPSKYCAYSNDIILPAGTRYLFGRFNIMNSTSGMNTQLNDPTATELASTIMLYAYHDTSDNAWHSVTKANFKLGQKPFVIGKKDGLFYSNNYSVALCNGAIIGLPFNENGTIDKISVNWFRSDGETVEEIGLALPELYAGF